MSGQSIILSSYRVTSPTWFPATKNVTGTVAITSTRAVSIGGDFIADGLQAGDWLVNTNGNIARKIANIFSSTVLELQSEFPADLPGATCVAIKDKAMKSLKVVFTVNDGNIRGANQDTNTAWPFGIPWESQSYDDFIQPQLITPGGGGASVIIGE